MDHKVTTDYTRQLINSNVKVYVRARPCADGQEPSSDMFERKKETPKNIVIKDSERMQYGNHAFSFDNVFWTETSQTTLFECTSRSLVDMALKGINSCCFAFGQTGSGKTFSIFGEGGDKSGLLPRSIEYLFNKIGKKDSKAQRTTLAISFLEIYCDRVRDLSREYLKKVGRPISFQTSSSTDWYFRQQQLNRIDSTSSMTSSHNGKADEEYDYEKANFEIHEDALGCVFVKDLSMVTVTSKEEVNNLVKSGLKLRATHETKMNAVSSRSHTVFTIHIFQQAIGSEEVTCGMLNMIDLAGYDCIKVMRRCVTQQSVISSLSSHISLIHPLNRSERLKKSESDGQRLKEALHINSSLSAVGKVVMSLDPESGYQYIPYRDSKLTRLLQNSIGGNSYTILLATIHPMKEHYDECLSTLQFANRCRSVQNQPRVNHINSSASDKDKRIRKLQDEISYLRRQLEGLKGDYNQKFVQALNELGFEAEEVTEAGEIKFANGMVLTSIFSEDQEVKQVQFTDQTSIGLAMDLNDTRIQTGEQRTSKNDREAFRWKMADTVNSFNTAMNSAKQQNEVLRKQLSGLKQFNQDLEKKLTQKTKEHELALKFQQSQHKQELIDLLHREAAKEPLLKTTSRESNSCCFQATQSPCRHRNRSCLSYKEKLHYNQNNTCAESTINQKVAVLETCKENDIELIRQQYSQILLRRGEEINQMQKGSHMLEELYRTKFQNLRDDCIEIYKYVRRLIQACESKQRGQQFTMPNNILADPFKLRHLKTLVSSDTSENISLLCDSSLVVNNDTNHKVVTDGCKQVRPLSAPLCSSSKICARGTTGRNENLKSRTNYAFKAKGKAFAAELRQRVEAVKQENSDISGIDFDIANSTANQEFQVPEGSNQNIIATLKQLLIDERKKYRALKSANVALIRRQERILKEAKLLL